MFTFCFTSVAAAQLRQIREIPKSTRQTTVAARTVKLGLATMAVLAMASMAQAGGFSAHPAGNFSSMGSRNSGSNFFNASNQSNKVKLNQTSGGNADSSKPITLNNTLKNPNKISTDNSGNKVNMIEWHEVKRKS